MKEKKVLLATALMILLTAGAISCGGGSKDPVNNNPNQNQNTGGATLSGRVLDREGTPCGQPWVTVELHTTDGQMIAPSQQPKSSGPSAGRFEFIGVPIGIQMVLDIELFQSSLGRNLGWSQKITLTSGGNFDLGDITLENDFLELGWAAYISKDYSGAIHNFQRAMVDRTVQANLSYSSSAYTGLGWVYAKRGKDNQTGLMYVDPDTGAWLDTINSYEWDQALTQFKKATTNPNDSDAWVGMAGTYLTLVGQANKDPIVIGPWIPFYAFLHFYFGEAEDALEKALLVDPDYKCPHDEISANDLKATLLFVRWMQGQQVTQEEVATLSKEKDLNQGSRQLLEAMTDLVAYNPYPQL